MFSLSFVSYLTMGLTARNLCPRYCVHCHELHSSGLLCIPGTRRSEMSPML